MNNTTLLNKLGTVGSGATTICFWHCLLMPILIAAFPAIGFLNLLHGWVELTLLGSGIIFTALSLCWGYRIHRQLRAFAFFMAAVMYLILSHSNQPWVGHPLIFSCIGAVCMIVANLLNKQLCRTCQHCCKH